MPSFFRRVADTRSAAPLLIMLLSLTGGAAVAQEPAAIAAEATKVETEGTAKAPAEPAPNGKSEATAPAPAVTVQLPELLAKEVERARWLTNRLESVEKSVTRVRDRDEELNQRLPTLDKILSDAVVAADHRSGRNHATERDLGRTEEGAVAKA